MSVANSYTAVETMERLRHADGLVLALTEYFNGQLGRELTYLAARCGQPRDEESASDRAAHHTSTDATDGEEKS